MKRQKREWKFTNYFFKSIWKLLLFLIKSPYYFVKAVYNFSGELEYKTKKLGIKQERAKIKPIYDKFKIIKGRSGDYEKWLKSVYDSDSKIGIILGSRGSGKSAFGIRFLENLYSKKKKNCYAIGFDEGEMPSWINVISDVNQISNNSFVLIDEGGVLFSSRNSMSNANKLLSKLILIARHKNLSILFISQNSSNLEINILRQADFIILKSSSLLQKDFERKIIQKIYENTEGDFKKFKDIKGITYIYSDEFKGFVSNTLPSFWRTNISKSFK